MRAIATRHLPELAELPIEQAAEQLVRRHAEAQRDRELRASIERELGEIEAQRGQLRDRDEQAERVLQELLRDGARGRPRGARADRAALPPAARARTRARRRGPRPARVRRRGGHRRARGAGRRAERRARTRPARRAARGARGARRRPPGARSQDRPAALRASSWSSATISPRSRRPRPSSTWRASRATRTRYVRKRLAVELLERELRRYRDANQGPIVGRASALFARLTLGALPEARGRLRRGRRARAAVRRRAGHARRAWRG